MSRHEGNIERNLLFWSPQMCVCIHYWFSVQYLVDIRKMGSRKELISGLRVCEMWWHDDARNIGTELDGEGMI
jgi:hypothetical protein